MESLKLQKEYKQMFEFLKEKKYNNNMKWGL